MISYTVHVPIVKGSCDVNYWYECLIIVIFSYATVMQKKIVKQMFRIKVILLHCLFVAESDK